MNHGQEGGDEGKRMQKRWKRMEIGWQTEETLCWCPPSVLQACKSPFSLAFGFSNTRVPLSSPHHLRIFISSLHRQLPRSLFVSSSRFIFYPFTHFTPIFCTATTPSFSHFLFSFSRSLRYNWLKMSFRKYISVFLMSYVLSETNLLEKSNLWLFLWNICVHKRISCFAHFFFVHYCDFLWATL